LDNKLFFLFFIFLNFFLKEYLDLKIFGLQDNFYFLLREASLICLLNLYHNEDIWIKFLKKNFYNKKYLNLFSYWIQEIIMKKRINLNENKKFEIVVEYFNKILKKENDFSIINFLPLEITKYEFKKTTNGEFLVGRGFVRSRGISRGRERGRGFTEKEEFETLKEKIDREKFEKEEIIISYKIDYNFQFHLPKW
jgi:hypothetical protein